MIPSKRRRQSGDRIRRIGSWSIYASSMFACTALLLTLGMTGCESQERTAAEYQAEPSPIDPEAMAETEDEREEEMAREIE